MKKHKFSFYLFNSIIPLIIGQALRNFVRVDSEIDIIFKMITGFDIPYCPNLLDYKVIEILSNHLFDFIWAYSFTTMTLLWLHEFDNNFKYKQVIIVALIMDIVIEFIGVFDPIDIMVNFFATFIALVVYQKTRMKTLS